MTNLSIQNLVFCLIDNAFIQIKCFFPLIFNLENL